MSDKYMDGNVTPLRQRGGLTVHFTLSRQIGCCCWNVSFSTLGSFKFHVLLSVIRPSIQASRGRTVRSKAIFLTCVGITLTSRQGLRLQPGVSDGSHYHKMCYAFRSNALTGLEGGIISKESFSGISIVGHMQDDHCTPHDSHNFELFEKQLTLRSPGGKRITGGWWHVYCCFVFIIIIQGEKSIFVFICRKIVTTDQINIAF